jgi:uncharacterized SAM-binding protein YcdF (DUF218 family)
MQHPTPTLFFDMFILKKTLSVLILPPLAPLLLIMIGLLLVRRRPRTGKLFAWGGLLLALALITPATVNLLLEDLETSPPLQMANLKGADAIIILGGGSRSYAPEFGGTTVNRLTLERLRYGARLARQSKLPVMVTGGATNSEVPEGTVMKAALQEDFGVPVRWVESRSLDTRENAELCAAALLPAGVRRVVLVTHAAHMRRAVELFEHAGFQVVPAPTAFFLDRSPSRRADVPGMPDMNSAYAAWYAAHEWVGLLANQLRR